MERFEVTRPDGVVHLTPIEARLLEYLVGARPRVVSREELLADVWGYAHGVTSRAADFAVRRLRQKIEADPTVPIHVLTVYGEGYRYDGPPIGATVATSVPVCDRSTIERPIASERLEAALGANRLVTLTGRGGVGKTTLAAQVLASRAAVRCDLQSHDKGSSAMGAVARTLASMDPTGVVVWLDHIESVLDAVAGSLPTWLREHPQATFLVTSRAPLGLAQEQRIRLDPLGSDAARQLLADLLARHGGIEFAATDSEVVDAVERVDRLPLGIEIAAGRLSLVGSVPQAASDLLELPHPHRDVAQRHSSLRRSYDRSWEILGANVKRALARLAVFDGAFTAELAVRVLDAVPSRAQTCLADLRRRGLVEGDPRGLLTLSTTQRSYVRQMAPGAVSESWDRAASHALELGREDHAQSARMSETYRALIGRAIQVRPELATRLLRAVETRPYAGDLPRYLVDLNRLLGRLDPGPSRCWILMMRTQIHRVLGDNGQARVDLEEAAELVRQHPDALLRGHVLSTRIFLERVEGNFDGAVAAFLADEAWVGTLEDPKVRARIEMAAGLACVALPERWALAQRLLRTAGARYLAVGATQGESHCRMMLGRLYLRMGRLEEAEALHLAALDPDRVDRFVDVWALISLAELAVGRDAFDEARDRATDALSRVSTGAHIIERGYCLSILARLEVLEGHVAGTLPYMLQIDAILMQERHPLTRTTCLLTRALVAHAQGLSEDVIVAADEALTLVDDAQSTSRTLALGIRSLALVELERIDEARQDVDALCEQRVPDAVLALLSGIVEGDPPEGIPATGLSMSRHLRGAAEATLSRLRARGARRAS